MENVEATNVVNTPVANTEATVTPQETAPSIATTQSNEVAAEATLDASNSANAETIVDTSTQTQENVNIQDTPEIAELKSKLREYELRDEEVKALSQRLGVPKDLSPEIMQAEQQMAILNNQAQQAYINLCNEYGVDYRVDKIEASANELANKDPKKYYDLLYKLNQLDSQINVRRNDINRFIRGKQTEKAVAKYNDFLTASPQLNNALKTYLSQANIPPQYAVDMFFQTMTPLCQEMFNMGKIYAEQQAIQSKNSPASVLNNSTIGANTAYAGTAPKIFTRKEIAAMDEKTFAKYEKEIDRQAREGLIK